MTGIRVSEMLHQILRSGFWVPGKKEPGTELNSRIPTNMGRGTGIECKINIYVDLYSANL